MGVNGIYGLSGSGMDIESMVKVGMLSKQSEYDKMAQKYTKNEWMKADYIELSNQITTFNASTLSQYKMSTTMNAKSAESSSSAVKVSANSSAATTSHRVEVLGLSTNAYVISTAKPTRYGDNATSMEIKDMLFSSLTSDGNGKVSGTINGTNFTADENDSAIEFTLSDGVTKNTDGSDKTATIKLTYKQLAEGASMTDLVSQIKNAGLNLNAAYDFDHDSFSIYNKNNGLDNKLSISVTANDVYTTTKTTTIKQTAVWRSRWTNPQYTDHITTSTTNTFETVYTDVAGTATAAFLNSWSLYQSKDGDLYQPGTSSKKADGGTSAWSFTGGAEETVVNQTQTIITDISNNHHDTDTTVTDSTTNNTTNGSASSISGENSTMKIDGIVYDDIQDNKISINGVTYTAVDRTNGTSAVVSITQDTDAIVDKVKSFVADYNKLLASLYEKYDEKPNSDYKPLTQSQKDSMKEEQITKWEEKAKAGLLYHDQTIGKIIQNMRNAISTGVEQDDGSTASVFSLGISTTGLKGQLVLDEDKLRKALDKDPDIVYNVLSKPDLNVTSKNGVAQKLGDIFTDAVSTIKKRAGSSSDVTEDSDLNNLLRQLQTRMSNFKKMMATYENALYKKYDAMEATLAKLGTQLNFVMGGNA